MTRLWRGLFAVLTTRPNTWDPVTGLSGSIRWITDQWEQDAPRRFLWAPVLVGAGSVTYAAMPFEPAPVTTVAVLVAATLFAIAMRARTGTGGPAGLILLTFAIGFGAAQWQTARHIGPVLERHEIRTDLTGTIAAVEPYRVGARILLSDVVPTNQEAQHDPLPNRVRLTLRRDAWTEDLKPGDRIRIRAVLRKPSPPVEPHAFDFRRHAFFQGIGAVGYAIAAPDIVPGSANTGLLETWRVSVQCLRLEIIATLRDILPGEQAALAAALIVGERKMITDDTLQALRDSGLAHLLAISGLHIGLVAGLLLFSVRLAVALLGLVGPTLPAKKIAAVCALIGAFGYLQLAGATIPTQRAFVMVGIALLAVMLDRTAISMRTLAISAIIVLLVHPASVTGPSFQMSFAAVIALVAVYEAIRARRTARGHERGGGAGPLASLGTYFGAILISTFIAGLATAPFAAFHFNRVADYGLLANLIAIPIVGLWIMPMALIGTLLIPFGLAAVPLILMGHGIALMTAAAHFVSGLDGAVSMVPAVPSIALALWVTGFLWLCLWNGTWRFIGIAPCLLALITAISVQRPDILVAPNGRLVGVHTDRGDLMLPPGRRDGFTREIWLERSAQTRSAQWPWPTHDQEVAGFCDASGCTWTLDGTVVAWARERRAIPEDCRLADIIITGFWINTPCPNATLVIDGRTLRSEGAQAIWIGADSLRRETVGATAGDRPWTR